MSRHSRLAIALAAALAAGAAAAGPLPATGGAVGLGEAMIAGGDSGGGDFVWDGYQWLLSGVHSWGWEVGGPYGVCSAFGLANCDSRPDNGTSYGHLSGSTATFDQLSWIGSVTAVPEPQSFSMLLAGMIALFSVSRRR